MGAHVWHLGCRPRMKPEFICIGAQKAGTTWLFGQLAKHPEFSMLPVKEFHYFDRSPEYPSPKTLGETKLRSRLKDREWRKWCLRSIGRALFTGDLKRARWWSRYHLRTFSDEWYLSLFKSADGITGDVTPGYSLLEEKDVRRMRDTVPSAKILFLIRNPIDRAWSMFRHAQKFGIELDAEDLEDFKKRVEAPRQSLRSDYLRTIDLYSKYYPPGQILLGFFDAVAKDPRALLKSVLAFLGAEDVNFSHDIGKKVNQSKPQPCPPVFRDYLVQKYADDIAKLSDRFGSYASVWLRELNGDADPKGAETPAPVVRL